MTNPNPTLDAKARQLLRDTAEFFETHELALGAFARNANGNATWVRSPHACGWCTLGALDKLSNDPDLLEAAEILLLRYVGLRGFSRISHWSDANPKYVVIAGLRAAAESGEV